MGSMETCNPLCVDMLHHHHHIILMIIIAIITITNVIRTIIGHHRSRDAGKRIQQEMAAGGRWQWRTHLQGSQGYWEGWYRGLSDRFLKVPAPKVLIIADTNRGDMMIGLHELLSQPRSDEMIFGACTCG